MYALTENNKFIRWIDLQKDYPNTSFPSFINHSDLPDNVVFVEVPNPDPLPDLLHVAEKNSEPVFKEGKWYLEHSIRPMTYEESKYTIDTASSIIRTQRNRLLSETDWTQIADAPVDRLVWADYRQKLRNISTQEHFPFIVEWPEPPVNILSN